MFEHVGERMLPTYFQRAWALLRPGGVFLNHGIALRGTDRCESRADLFQQLCLSRWRAGAHQQ